MTSLFADVAPVRYAGPDGHDPLSFRFYDPDLVLGGKRLADHLRFTTCYWHSFYWHSFVYDGADPFGRPTIARPWSGGDMASARLKADEAFRLFAILGTPFYAFHDRDAAPEGADFAESARNLREIADLFARRQQETGVGLLWGTANLFSHPRYMAGAATNPDPDVFAYAAATVKECLDVTHGLGGANYVLWGGREGYDTLLNTDLRRELDQMGRFLSMVVDYKHKIGFAGTILLEPKPKEPTKHQYDFDAATVYAFLARYGLEREVKLNLEANHATLAGHSFEHEIALARAYGVLGSLDMNRGDPLLGWDTDQFPNNVPELTLAMLEVIRAGGLGTGGLNFDARVRRQSIDPMDLVHAHVGGMDTCARAFLAAWRITEDGALDRAVAERYGGWASERAQGWLDGSAGLDDVAAAVRTGGIDPRPRSGGQERLENLVNRHA